MSGVRSRPRRPTTRATERAHLEAERAVVARRMHLERQALAAHLMVGGQERLWERGEIRWGGEERIEDERLT